MPEQQDVDSTPSSFPTDPKATSVLQGLVRELQQELRDTHNQLERALAQNERLVVTLHEAREIIAAMALHLAIISHDAAREAHVAVERLTVPSDEKRTPLTKWMPRMLGPGWVRHYDGAIIYESEVLDLMNDEALSALLREKRRRRA